VYRRRIDDRVLTFGVSGMLLHNALLMFDRETGTLWSHLTGEAMAGPLKGRRLPALTSIPQVKWRVVQREFPAALVLSVDGAEDAAADSYAGYRADPQRFGVRPPQRRDERLPGKELVIGARLGATAKAYLTSAIGPDGAVNDTLAGVPVVVARSEAAGASAVYGRELSGKVLEFEPRLVGGMLRDRTTGTTWNLLTGLGQGGPLAGKRLTAVPFVNVYWFAWADYYPDTEIYGRSGVSGGGRR
jgi:hypothetical protein